MSHRGWVVALAFAAAACGKPEPSAAPAVAPVPAAPAAAVPPAPASGTATATATATVKVAPKDDPWAQQRGDLPFVVGMDAGLAQAKAAGKAAFVFYTQHG